MTATFDQDFWERRWAQALHEHADVVADRPPHACLLAEAVDLSPGQALDAGCGHGAESMWLAAHGWKVTAIDVADNVLAHARSRAETLGPDIAARIEWLQSDLTTWAPPPDYFDLVVSLYVHVPGPVSPMVRRLSAGVAPGGALLLVGHRPVDPATGRQTAAAGQNQISVDDALAALEPREWQILIAEERPRAAAGSGVDAVIRATRLPS